ETPMTSIYLSFGDEPDQWRKELRVNMWVSVVIAPLFFLSALTSSTRPSVFFSFEASPVSAALSIAALVFMVGMQLAGSLLLQANRALGLIVSALGLLYLSPMVG